MVGRTSYRRTTHTGYTVVEDASAALRSETHVMLSGDLHAIGSG